MLALRSQLASCPWHSATGPKDVGFRRGDSQLLAVMAYATPLCSALLLGALGIEVLTWNLLIGAVVIAVAGVLSRADPQAT